MQVHEAAQNLEQRIARLNRVEAQLHTARQHPMPLIKHIAQRAREKLEEHQGAFWLECVAKAARNRRVLKCEEKFGFVGNALALGGRQKAHVKLFHGEREAVERAAAHRRASADAQHLLQLHNKCDIL